MKEKATVEWSKRIGKKRSYKPIMLQLYIKLIKKPKTPLRKLSIELQTRTTYMVSYSTIKNTVNDYNIRAFTPIKKPLLSKKNILTRFEKSRQFLLLLDNETKEIVFSDESKLNFFDLMVKILCNVKPEQTLKHIIFLLLWSMLKD